MHDVLENLHPVFQDVCKVAQDTAEHVWAHQAIVAAPFLHIYTQHHQLSHAVRQRYRLQDPQLSCNNTLKQVALDAEWIAWLGLIARYGCHEKIGLSFMGCWG